MRVWGLEFRVWGLGFRDVYYYYGIRPPESHNKDGLLGPISIIVVYVTLLGYLPRQKPTPFLVFLNMVSLSKSFKR